MEERQRLRKKVKVKAGGEEASRCACGWGKVWEPSGGGWEGEVGGERGGTYCVPRDEMKRERVKDGDPARLTGGETSRHDRLTVRTDRRREVCLVYQS